MEFAEEPIMRGQIGATSALRTLYPGSKWALQLQISIAASRFRAKLCEPHSEPHKTRG